MSHKSTAQILVLFIFISCCGEIPDPYLDADSGETTQDTNGTSDTVPESDSDTSLDTGQDSNSNGNTDSINDFESDNVTDTDTDTDTVIVADTHSDTDTDTDTNTHIDTDTDIDTDLDTDTGTDSGASVDLSWVSINGGKFKMGSADGDADEKPVDIVKISDFKMLKTEVTVTQYAACVTAGSCTKPGSGGKYDNWGAKGRENHPINRVDWHQAVAFCTWAGGRLPTEAEWEYAASNGSSKDVYPWGDAKATCHYAVMHEGEHGCGTGLTMAVCSKNAGNTTHGLCDMAGNLWEWVQDRYHASYKESPGNGSAWEESVGSDRVRRGGSFVNIPVTLRAANRDYDSPSNKGVTQGFRCAK